MNIVLPILSFCRNLRIVACLVVLQFVLITANAQFREIYKNTGTEGEIRGMSFLTPATGYVAFLNYAGFTTDSGHTYTRRDIAYGNTDYNGYAVNLTFGFAPSGVQAFSQDSLLLYGDFGTEPSILFSANGGKTWKVVFHRALNINATSFNQGITDMKFPGNGSVGFAVHNEEVLKTTDRGQHWNTVVNVPDGNMRKLSFPSVNTGYAIGGDKLFKTADNGNSWNILTLPRLSAGSNFNNVFFITDNTGYVTDETYNRIFKTNNSGAAWTQMNDENLVPISGSDLFFTNDSTGFVASTYSYWVYKTINNGKTWEPCKRNSDYHYLGYGLNALYFYNNQIAWAGGKSEYLMITTDGASQTLPRAYFNIDTSGLAATSVVSLINYSNAGYQYQWYKNDVPISTDFNTTYVHDPQQQHDVIKLVVSNGTEKDTMVKDVYFEVRPLPVITDFYPKTGSTGTRVVINGSNFDGINTVSFGGVPAGSFMVVSSNQIIAAVGAGATGDVTVGITGGSSASAAGFVYTAPPSSPPPVITAFSPASGPVGTVVTISGSNFSTNAANNVVYFGTIKAAITAASANQLICKVPVAASLQPISVLNTQTHLSGTSCKGFNVTFADSSNFTPHSFDMGYSIDYSGELKYPNSVSAGDIDGDGKPDIVASSYFVAKDSIIVYRNTTTAGSAVGFDAGIGIPASARTTSSKITLGDIDGDGKPDFAIAPNSSSIAVARNISTPGKIAAEPAIQIPTAPGSQKIVIEDLDNDGRADLAVATFDTKTLSVVRNTSTVGNLSFAARIDFPVGGNAVSIAAGDFDGDGKKDIVVDNFNYATGSPASFTVYKNTSTTGNITFAPKLDIETPALGTQSQDIFAEDVNGDNKPDVLVLNDHFFTVYKNITANGMIAFDKGKVYDDAGIAQGAYIDNLNGDAKPDFISGDFGSRALHLFDNFSTADSISFGSTVDMQEVYPQIESIYYSACADFNGDGKQDIAVVSLGTYDNYIFVLNNTIGKSIPFTVCPTRAVSIESDISGDSYQWQQNSGNGFNNISDNNYISGASTSTLTFTHPPALWNGYAYRCVSGDRKSTAYLLTVNTTPLPKVTISSKDSSVCPGAKLTFVAKGTNTGPGPFFQWQVNGKDIPNYGSYNVITKDSTSTFFTFELHDSDAVSVIVHGSDPCNNDVYDTSNVIRASVIGGGYPLVKINSSAASACIGDSITFTATTTYCGAHPSYQWQVNGFDAGTNSAVFGTRILENTDVIFVTVTPEPTACNAGQVATDAVIIPVNSSGTPAVVISTVNSVICKGTLVTFTATATNAGSLPTYQWQVNGKNAGANSAVFTTDALQDKDQVTVTLTSNATCVAQPTVMSNIITMAVTAITANAGTDQTICAGAAITIGSAATANSSYAWTSDPAGFTSSQAAPIIQPTAFAKYFLTVINGNCTAQDTVAINVVQSIANAGADQTICYGGNAKIGSARLAGNNYAWSSVPAGFAAAAADPQVDPKQTTSYIVQVTNGNCAASDTVVITVNPALALSLTDTLVNVCAGSSTVIGVPAQPGFQYNWTSMPAGFTSTVSNPAVSPAVPTTYVLTATNSANGCASAGTVQVNPASCNDRISLYPNPAKEFIHVQLDTLTSSVTVFQLIDVNGTVLLQQNLNFNTQINISTCASGLYQFVIRRNNTVISKGRLLVLH